MATYPTSLSNAFDDKVVPVLSIVSVDIKERSLRQAVLEYSIRRPDRRSHSISGNGTNRVALPTELLAELAVFDDDPIEHLWSIEDPIDEVPIRVWDDDWWTITPFGRVPTHLAMIYRTIATAVTFRLEADRAWDYQLPAPAAPTITGTVGASSWTYRICARDATASTDPSSTTTYASAAADMAGLALAPHTITWTAIYRAVSYDVWLTAAPVGVALGKVGSAITGTSFVHDVEVGAGTVPTTNATETTVPRMARDPVAAFGGYLALATVMGKSVPNTPDGTGGAPVDWAGVLDNAEKLRRSLYKEFMDFLARTEVKADNATAKAFVTWFGYDAEERYGDPALAVYRSPRQRG